MPAASNPASQNNNAEQMNQIDQIGPAQAAMEGNPADAGQLLGPAEVEEESKVYPEQYFKQMQVN